MQPPTTRNNAMWKPLRYKPHHANAWYNLGVGGGGVVFSRTYGKIECYQHALELQPDDADAWCKLWPEDGVAASSAAGPTARLGATITP